MYVTDEIYEKSFDACQKYINDVCIWRSKNGEKIPSKAPGHYYSWQFYLRRGFFNVSFMNTFTNLFVYHIEREVGHFDFQITGMETGATPLVSALTIFCKGKFNIEINGFSVRKERKQYGLRNHIEGIIAPNTPILIVDDMCNSAQTVSKCYDVIQKLGHPLLDVVFTAVNKTNSFDEQKMKNDKYFQNLGIENVKFIAPFTLDDFNLTIPIGGDMYMFDGEQK